jgi:hypothetical protein
MPMLTSTASEAGVDRVKRALFRARLFESFLPMLRSGRFNVDMLREYRNELNKGFSMSIAPTWLKADVAEVLDKAAKVIANPKYVEESSLAGDFGNYGGLFDWVIDAAGSVWGSTKEAAGSVWGSTKEAAGSVWGSTKEAATDVVERILPGSPETGTTTPSTYVADVPTVTKQLPPSEPVLKFNPWYFIIPGAILLLVFGRK